MCGRYALAASEEALIEAFDVPGLTFEHQPRYNIAPGTLATVVAEDARGRRAGLLLWGFVPAWKEKASSGFINARAESVATKASFREAYRRRRCLVPADGFYEWKKSEGGAKTPYWVHPPDGGVISFAGIWETWSAPGSEPLHSFAVLTTRANADVAPVHDRMPVVVRAADRSRWLSRATPVPDLKSLLRPSPAGTFSLHPVSPRVNRPDQDDAGLIEPADEPPA